MSQPFPILNIEAAPGDAPRAVEQVNGDLLLPQPVRPLVAKALLQVEEAISQGQRPDAAALADVMRLLGIVKVDKAQQTLLANLMKVKAI